MKPRLKTFRDFVGSLLPHEIEYLHSVAKFSDAINRELFERVVTFSRTARLNLDESIDKRKYSYLKKWMIRQLESVDVDRNFEILLDLDKKVMTDHVLPAHEKEILKIIRSHERLPFYFMRTYELVRNYQSFLLIRVRHQYHRIVKNYLDRYRDAYRISREIFEKLNTATQDIIDQYSFSGSDASKWEGFLRKVCFDENLDGLNRYYAMVRLTFLYYNYNRLNRIGSLYDYLDRQFSEGKFYSRRILLNYYSNRLLLHAKLNQPELAEKYGYLSIRDKSSDYIHYTNNLCAVLLGNKKANEALKLMQHAIPELKKTMSYHNRVGFASVFIKSLNANDKAAEAESYGHSFFKAYKEKVMLYRWHSFFSAWLQSMILQEKYRQVLTICRRQKIMEKEKFYSERPAYVPTILWYYQLARYKTGEIDLSELKAFIRESSGKNAGIPGINRLKNELGYHVPELLK